MPKLESGKVKNETVTTYKGADKDGNTVTEKVTKNKETGEVKRELDGKEMPKENKSTVLRYQPSNGEFLQVKLLDMLVRQNKEMAYYLRQMAKKMTEIDDEELKKLLNDG